MTETKTKEGIFEGKYKFVDFVDLSSIKVYSVGDKDPKNTEIFKDKEHEVAFIIQPDGILCPIGGLDMCKHYYISYEYKEKEVAKIMTTNNGGMNITYGPASSLTFGGY